MRGSVHHSQQATKLVDHIRELRKRFIISFVALIAAGVVVYVFYQPVLNFLRSPLDAPLFYSTPAGSFSFVMKICFMGALAIAIPVIVFNLIMFIRPAFAEHIPVRRVIMTAIASAFLAFAGAAFGFYYIIPGALHFFAGFQVAGLSALISADSYLGFVTNVIITFVLVFQLPLLIVFIDRVKPLRPRTLLAGEKWVVLGSLVISVLVPFAFDLVTTLLIALPIVVLYNLAIIVVAFQHMSLSRKTGMLQPHFDQDTIPSSGLAFETLSFEELVGHDYGLTPVAALQSFDQPTETVMVPRRHRGVMDIQKTKKAPAPVAPAAWVHRVHPPIPLDSRMRLVTDIHRRVSA